MADLSTTKIFTPGQSVSETDLNAIVVQTSALATLISAKSSGGATVDTDELIINRVSGGGLQKVTALSVKNYLGQVFIPSGVGVAAGLQTVTTAAVVAPSTGAITSLNYTTIAGRTALGWLSCLCQPAAGATAISMSVFRQDSASCGTFLMQFPGPVTGSNSWPISFQWVDGSTIAGSTTYYCCAQSIGASTGVLATVFTCVQR